ncbi:MAG: hypothetical protein Q8L10_03785 [Candidatus Moranbacteria bacterium]|nr:hypothetical protein [Candidatus Moranbacteria bacterium]
MKNNLEKNQLPDAGRYVLGGYFGNAQEFGSLVLKKIRSKELDPEEMDRNRLRFVSRLIGADRADKLSAEEMEVFLTEARRVVSENKKMIDGAKAHWRKEAERVGFVGMTHDKEGKSVFEGDSDAVMEDIND